MYLGACSSLMKRKKIRAFPANCKRPSFFHIESHLLFLVPRELLDKILFLYLNSKTKLDLPEIYQKLRKKSKVCRMAFGDQESANLFDDKDIDNFIGLSRSFDNVFQNSINFGGLCCLEIQIPTTFDLCSSLGHTLSTSGVIHLNIHCGGSPAFMQDLQTPGWRMALQRLQVFRIKYIVSVEEVCPFMYSCPVLNDCLFIFPRMNKIHIHGIILHGSIYFPPATLSICFC
jgi:hypothetical protein